MTGPIVVVILLMAAQAVAAGVMTVLGMVLQHFYHDPHWGAWIIVGAVGVAASIGFLGLILNAQRWMQWLK